jgi:hypothetical protein
MRDVAHTTRQPRRRWGLSEHNFNMLHRFDAERERKPRLLRLLGDHVQRRALPRDYADDNGFLYNLPANFDIMDACWRMFQWTGRHPAITAPERSGNFYRVSAESTIRRWTATATA